MTPEELEAVKGLHLWYAGGRAFVTLSVEQRDALVAEVERLRAALELTTEQRDDAERDLETVCEFVAQRGGFEEIDGDGDPGHIVVSFIAILLERLTAERGRLESRGRTAGLCRWDAGSCRCPLHRGSVARDLPKRHLSSDCA